MRTALIVGMLMLAAGTGWAEVGTRVEVMVTDNERDCAWARICVVQEDCGELRAAATEILKHFPEETDVLTLKNVVIYGDPSSPELQKARKRAERDAAIQRLRDALRGKEGR
jgi:hypothetical protein